MFQRLLSHKLDGHFSILFVVKIVMHKKQKRGWEWPIFKKMSNVF